MADLRERLEQLAKWHEYERNISHPEKDSYHHTVSARTLREVLAHPEKLSSPSATGAISKEMIWKIACIETNQTTIGGKPVVGTDAAEKIATMLAAAPAPAEPVDVLVLQESIKALDEVNTAWFNELEEIKKIVGYVPAECKQTLTRYIKGIVEKATSPVVEAERTSEIVGWMVEGICDGEEIVRDLFDELDKDQAIAFQKNNGGLIVPLVALRDAAPQLHPDMKGEQS